MKNNRNTALPNYPEKRRLFHQFRFVGFRLNTQQDFPNLEFLQKTPSYFLEFRENVKKGIYDCCFDIYLLPLSMHCHQVWNDDNQMMTQVVLEHATNSLLFCSKLRACLSCTPKGWFLFRVLQNVPNMCSQNSQIGSQNLCWLCIIQKYILIYT